MRRWWGGLIGALLAPLLTSCAATQPELDPHAYTTSSPAVAWKPAPSEVSAPMAGEKPPAIPVAMQPATEPLTLPELIATALQINPTTRTAWENARTAAAAWAVTRGRYYPSAAASARAEYARGGVPTEFLNQSEEIEIFGAALRYLLLDFGGRSATAEAARQALIAANWSQNRAMQTVVFQVSRSYYDLIGNEAQVRAAETSLTEAQTSVRATQERLQAGVGTIADVLQAQSDEARRRLDLVTIRGDVHIKRGELATNVGWAANTPYTVVEARDPIPTDAVRANADELIERAQHDRPDLAAARAEVRRSEAAVDVAQSAMWPELGGVASVERFYRQDAPSSSATTYLFGLTVDMPLFEGFALVNRVREAESARDAAVSRLRTLSESVMNDVWKAYYEFRTAAEQVDAAEALYASAAESYRVWLGLYRAGAADIVELLNAQTLLATARAEIVRTHTALFRSYAAIVYAVGARADALPPR